MPAKCMAGTSTSSLPPLPLRRQGTPSPVGSQNTSPFLCKQHYGATQPLISLPELVLAKHYPEFFHGRDSVRYQTRSENTFIFHLHRASLLGKSLALHGVIVFPINSHNLQALSRWRKKHSRQRGESWELRRPIRWSWWNSKAQRCEPPSGS